MTEIKVEKQDPAGRRGGGKSVHSLGSKVLPKAVRARLFKV
jgi:hypothetical protein